MPQPDELEEVADSTDWLSTPLSGLTAVEAALRCQVCKDFYKTPMLTSCNHTFCSICIRRALNNDGKCPLCRASEQEMKLRSNWSMEEVVAAFKQTRTHVMEFAQRPRAIVGSSAGELPKRRLDSDMAENSRASKRLRSLTRLSKNRSAELTTEMARQEAEQDESTPEIPIDDGLVACPICWTRMKEAQVDKHIDTSCTGLPQPHGRQASSPSTLNGLPNGFQTITKPMPSRNFERLPAINYSMLKDQQIRKKMLELGISNAGTRQMCEKRHKEWMTIWNANCDSLHPRSKRELLHDLDVWEKTLGTRAPTSSRAVNVGAQIKDKDFDQAAWSANHDSSFKDLIASARRNKAQAEQKVMEANASEEAVKDPRIKDRGSSV